MKLTSRSTRHWEYAAFVLRSLLTLLAATILLLEANGYAIDFTSLTMTKVGLVVIRPEPRDAHVQMDNVVLEKQGAQWMTELPEGVYQTMVSSPGYHPWKQTILIEAGKSSAFPYVFLFRTEPVLQSDRLATAEELRAPLVDPALRVEGGELWRLRADGDLLITRISQPISSAVLVDRAHVAFQARDALHIMDVNGTNDVVILGSLVGQQRLVMSGERSLTLIHQDRAKTYEIR